MLYTTVQRINAGGKAMAVLPGQVFAQARDVLAQGKAAYTGLSLLVLGIAALTVWLGVHAATLERQRALALIPLSLLAALPPAIGAARLSPLRYLSSS
jgi:putative ABC transport system permease protein